MTEKQLLGVLIRAMGIWFLCQVIVKLTILMTMLDEFSFSTISRNGGWIFGEVIYVAIGIALLWFAPKIAEFCYKLNNKQD